MWRASRRLSGRSWRAGGVQGNFTLSQASNALFRRVDMVEACEDVVEVDRTALDDVGPFCGGE